MKFVILLCVLSVVYAADLKRQLGTHLQIDAAIAQCVRDHSTNEAECDACCDKVHQDFAAELGLENRLCHNGCNRQDDVRITSLTPTTIATKAGGEVTMTCVFNQNLQIILAQNLQWAHRSSVPGSEPVLLTDQATLQAGATPPEKYNIVFDTQEDTTIALTVKNLDASDDGEFICQASPKAAGADQNDNLISSIKTTIFSDVENVELTFEEEASVSDESGTVVQRQMGGPFKVMCTASGFNPASGVSVVVTLDGQQVPTTMGEATLHEDMTAAAGAARYTVTVEGEIELGPEHHQKRVQCEARATFEGAAESLKASIPFDVVVYPDGN